MVVEYATLEEDEDTITPSPIIPNSRRRTAPTRTQVVESKLIGFLKHDRTECNYLILLFVLGVFCMLLSN
jgi:hypothetical protein